MRAYTQIFTTMLMFCISMGLSQAASAHDEKETGGSEKKWSLMIHGGAGTIERDNISPEKDAEIRAGLNRALEIGSKVLSKGGTAMDAITAAIIALENNPDFNAGKGAVFTWNKTNELDSSIMDGSDLSAGAVAGVTATKNPILLARAVKDNSPHVMLSGTGADQFSREQGLEQVDPGYFSTPRRLRQVERLLAKQVSVTNADYKFGTVGAVAMDSAGNMAAGTSTGGMTGKRWGRIGDSPIIGAGTYADNRACAISATGAGEYYIRLGVAHEICARMRFEGEDAKTAADHVIGELGDIGGTGGVIVAAPDGSFAWSYNTAGMYRGKTNSEGVKMIGIYGDEE